MYQCLDWSYCFVVAAIFTNHSMVTHSMVDSLPFIFLQWLVLFYRQLISGDIYPTSHFLSVCAILPIFWTPCASHYPGCVSVCVQSRMYADQPYDESLEVPDGDEVSSTSSQQEHHHHHHSPQSSGGHCLPVVGTQDAFFWYVCMALIWQSRYTHTHTHIYIYICCHCCCRRCLSRVFTVPVVLW